ncbi:MAG: hypothetical protein ACFE9S_20490, partial [Candidatus Hermodarchaeota archaeon]
DEIDFVIIRFDISSADGMEILNLLLTCLVNETTNETAVVYSYVSTKLNDTSAVMMNLPISVLQYVPWFCNFSDSLMGAKPETFGDWFWKSLNKLVNLIIGVIIAIAMAIVELVKLIVDFFIFILMDVLPILGYILWLIIRVAILIFIWISFIFVVFVLTLSILMFTLILIPIALIFNANMVYTINNVRVIFPDVSFSVGYNIILDFDNFLGFWVPSLNIFFELGNITIFNMFIRFWPPGFEMNLSNNNGLGSSGLNSSNLKMNSEENSNALYQNEIEILMKGMDHSFGIWSITITILTLSFALPSTYRAVKWGIQIAAFIMNLIGIFITLSNYFDYFINGEKVFDPYESFWYLLGTGFVSICSGIFIYKHGKSKILQNSDDFRGNWFKYIEIWENCHSIKNFILGEIMLSLFPEITEAVKYWAFTKPGVEVPDAVESLFEVMNGISFIHSVVQWAISLNFLNYFSYILGIQDSNYDKEVKQVSCMAIILGVIEIILGITLLFAKNNEI